MKQPQFSASRSGPMSMGTLIAIAIVMMFLVILFTQLASPTMGSAGRRIGAATGKAKNWEGSFKTAGCDRGRCCCITHMNTKADSFNRVILSGKLLGACDEGVTSMATTQPLLEDGTVIEHTVVNSTVTYTLSGKTIRWTNNKVPECDGFAYPSHPSKLLRKVYAQRASSWVGQYTPKPGANRRSCCVPQKVVISHSHEMFGILISLTKEGHDSRCFFNNDITTVHQTSALAPQGNIISKMADGQPIRFVLNGDNLLLDQPANEGCEGVSYVLTERPESSVAVLDDEDDANISKKDADAIHDS